jgi:hypothetical protein
LLWKLYRLLSSWFRHLLISIWPMKSVSCHLLASFYRSSSMDNKVIVGNAGWSVRANCWGRPFRLQWQRRPTDCRQEARGVSNKVTIATGCKRIEGKLVTWPRLLLTMRPPSSARDQSVYPLENLFWYTCMHEKRVERLEQIEHWNIGRIVAFAIEGR